LTGSRWSIEQELGPSANALWVHGGDRIIISPRDPMKDIVRAKFEGLTTREIAVALQQIVEPR
jgi:hypothetical protein